MTDTPDTKRLWNPVREQTADAFWIVLIVSVSITVLATRVFLELTGYPQIGDSTYHIAHVLWGGLLLFIAVTLPLSFINPYVRWITAVLGGIGTGLFIDEVGKFITQSNDYFIPLAFPIIYGFILTCVWLYWRIRHHQPRDTRTLLYHALEDMKQVLDNDLDPFEHRELLMELELVTTQANDPNEVRLAQALLSYLQAKELRLASQPNLAERVVKQLRHTVASRPAKWVLKAILLIGFGLIGINAIIKLVGLISLTNTGGILHALLVNLIVVSGKSEYVIDNVTLLVVSQLLVVTVGGLALLAMLLLLAGKEVWGLRIGTLALVFSLCIVNFLTFYFLQLYALLEAVSQLFLLIVATLYRWRFLDMASRQEKIVVIPQTIG